MTEESGYMSSNNSKETNGSSIATTKISSMTGASATEMPTEELADWAVAHNLEYPDDLLLQGLLMVASLCPIKYTLWKGDIHER
jgi:hypothetical protein